MKLKTFVKAMFINKEQRGNYEHVKGDSIYEG